MFSLGFAVTLLVILLGVVTISNQSPIRSEDDDKFLLTHKQLISKRSPADQQMNKAPKGGENSKTPGQNTLGMIADSYKTKNSSGGGNAPKCPAGFSGLMPHPTDCEQYLSCDAGTAFIQKCGPGTVFSPDHKTCDHPDNVDCSGPTQVPKTGLKEVPKTGPKEVPKTGPKEVPQTGPKEVPKTGLKEVPKTGLKEVPQTGDMKEKEKVMDPKKEKGGDKKEGNKDIGKGVDKKKEVVEKKGEDKKKEVEDKKNGKGEDKKKQVEEKKKVKREERVEKDEKEKPNEKCELKPHEMSFKTKGKKIQRDWSNIEN